MKYSIFSFCFLDLGIGKFWVVYRLIKASVNFISFYLDLLINSSFNPSTMMHLVLYNKLEPNLKPEHYFSTYHALKKGLFPF